MKNMKNKNTKIIHSDGKHSFLFWLLIPVVLVWLSVSYITGVILDKPGWFTNKNGSEKTNTVVSYFQDFGTFSENLDQPFVTLWFDDAWLSQYMAAYPILKKFDFPGVIAVPAYLVETPGYMNWAQLRTLQKNGWEMTDHSLEHNCRMNSWSREKIAYEYKTSKFILWKNNLSADIFVTPCGVDSDVMREEAKKMFIAYRTVDPGFNDPKNVDFHNLKVKNVDNDDVNLAIMKSWIDEAKKTKSWVIILFHKVGEKHVTSGDDEFNVSIDDLTEIVKYIKDSGIKVVVPHQILASQKI